jgi:vancomycin resistance protein VanJ
MAWKIDIVPAALTAFRRTHHIPFAVAGIALLVPIFFWFLGWLSSGDDWLPVRWGAFVAPWLALLTLLSAYCFWLSGRHWLIAPAVTLAFLILLPVLPQLSPVRWITPAETGNLRVMSFNVSTANDDFGDIAKLIVRERPDIVLLQQLISLPALDAKLNRLPGHIKYFQVPDHAADTIILSRFRLSQTKELFQRTTAVASIYGCAVRLWNYHAPHGQYAPAEQFRYFLEAGRALKDEKLPVIAGGDLNSTEFNSVQAPLRSELNDAFTESGAGFGFTFPSRIRRFGWLGPLFRIDHILDRSLKPAAAWTVDDNAHSDHFPVMATYWIGARCRRGDGHN